MRDRAVLVYLAVVAAGVTAILVAAGAKESDLAFTLGVRSEDRVVALGRGEEACQQPIDVSASFERVVFRPQPTGGVAPPVDVQVRSFARSAGGPLGEGRLPAGLPDGRVAQVDVGRVPAGSRVAVCLRNSGRSGVALYGGPPQAARSSTMFVDGRRLRRDLALVFLRPEPRSVLSLAPEMARRASLFRPAWATPSALVAVFVLVVTLLPVLVGVAIRSAR